ncbi:MAG: septum formation initiator family protein, partial [Bacteroidota bacterium]|nr:septum formation initiator family protein [Bacteroidota bacterium]
AKHYQQTPIGVAEPPRFNDRQIYTNPISYTQDPQARVPGYAVRPPARKITKRKVKTTNVVGVMILVAIVALFYVGNVIAVNNLAKEVNDLRIRHNQIVSMNEVLKAEINRKSSLDRISLLAQEQLGMSNPKEAPVWFEVDREKEAELLKK